MNDQQKRSIVLFHSVCRLKNVIRLHHRICDWCYGKPISFRMISPNHWTVTYAAGTYFHYDLRSRTWY